MKFLSVCIPIDWHVKQAAHTNKATQAVIPTGDMGSKLIPAARHVNKAVLASVPVMYFDPIATIPAVPT